MFPLVVAPMKFSLFAVPLLFASALFVGCASEAEVNDAANADEDVESAEATADLSASYANRFFGAYAIPRSRDFVEFETLVLNSDGAYTATVQAPPNVRCFRAPCTVVEKGRWNAYAQSGGHRISLRPDGGAKLRVYVATQSNSLALTLSRKGLRSRLELDILSRCGAMRCSSSTHCALLNGAPTCAPNQPPVQAPCVKTGCSGQICADSSRITTCEYMPAYACYQNAECKRQADGQCGFTKTTALTACLNRNQDPDGL